MRMPKKTGYGSRKKRTTKSRPFWAGFAAGKKAAVKRPYQKRPYHKGRAPRNALEEALGRRLKPVPKNQAKVRARYARRQAAEDRQAAAEARMRKGARKGPKVGEYQLGWHEGYNGTLDGLGGTPSPRATAAFKKGFADGRRKARREAPLPKRARRRR